MKRPICIYGNEPLNFIDIFSRMQIEEMILSGRPTMLFVEHDRRFAEKIATKMINLDDFAAIDNPKNNGTSIA